jgi:hypothetical protein
VPSAQFKANIAQGTHRFAPPQLDVPPSTGYLCLVARIIELSQILGCFTVFARLPNVSVVITGIVGSIGIIIAHGRP